MKIARRKSLPYLDKELWGLVSRYVRKSRSAGGHVQCFTCHRYGRIQDIQAGHYISRRWLAVKFDLRNIRPQCNECNCFKQGEPGLFRLGLIREMGIDAVIELEFEATTPTKFPRSWYEARIREFKEKLKGLDE